MPVAGWRALYESLLCEVAAVTERVADLDLTVELITHRFTPRSEAVLGDWYPASPLDMDEATRRRRRTRFGAEKFVYSTDVTRELRDTLETRIGELLPAARILYFT